MGWRPVLTRSRPVDLDTRDLPNYILLEAAAILRMSPQTLSGWCRGADRLIVPAESSPITLSFWNLVEASVIRSMRKDHFLPMRVVRDGIGFAKEKLESERPLITKQFLTWGYHLMVEHLGRLLIADRAGQMVLDESWIRAGLQRIQSDQAGLACRLHPWGEDPSEPSVIVVDPRISFGRPVLVGTGIPTGELASRFRAGDSLASLAEDFRVAEARIWDALRWERCEPAAA